MPHNEVPNTVVRVLKLLLPLMTDCLASIFCVYFMNCKPGIALISV